PLSAEERRVELPPLTRALPAHNEQYAPRHLLAALKGKRNADVPTGYVLRQLCLVVLPSLLFVLLATSTWRAVTHVEAEAVYDIQPIGFSGGDYTPASGTGLQEPPMENGLQEPPLDDADSLQEPPGADSGIAEPPGAETAVT